MTARTVRRKKNVNSGTENPGQAGAFVSFETTDLDGNIVRSSDIFSKNMITMVNIWGTFCGPCIDELPELEKLRYRLEKKGCAIVGIVSDVEIIGEPAVGARSEDDYEELIDALIEKMQ